MKVLIVDEIDHPMYRDVPVITIDMFRRWKGVNIYRLIGEADKILPEISKYCYNTFLVFEDASVYMEGKLEYAVKRFVISSKARNLDVLFQFHGFPEIPPRLLRYMDGLIIFKCSSPEYRKKELIEYEKVKRLYDEVMKNKDPHFYKQIMLR